MYILCLCCIQPSKLKTMKKEQVLEEIKGLMKLGIKEKKDLVFYLITLFEINKVNASHIVDLHLSTQ